MSSELLTVTAAARPINSSDATPTAAPKLPAHIPALDGLRGFAICLVLMHHFTWEPQPGVEFEGLPGALFQAIAYWGLVSVDLFFVLSGFLITGILLDEKASKHYFRNFYMRRVLRIVPLYYAVLLVLFVIIPRFTPLFWGPRPSHVDSPWWLWLYGTNILSAKNNAAIRMSDWLDVNHFWTLSVEEHFYAVWPVVVGLCSRRRLMAICGVLTVTALATRIGITAWYYPEFIQGANLLTPCRMDSLAVGSFLAAAVRGPRGLPGLVRPAQWTAGFAGAAMALCFGLKFFGDDAMPLSAVGLTFNGVFFGAVLILAISSLRFNCCAAIANLGFFRSMGKYSYGIYIYHSLLLLVLYHVMPPPELVKMVGMPILANILFLLVGTGVTVQIAWLSWNGFEKQFLKLKKYFEYEHDQMVTAEGARGTSETNSRQRTPAVPGLVPTLGESG
jgi:peptidoglycan/LPS O-acetylase OafA/YrhL